MNANRLFRTLSLGLMVMSGAGIAAARTFTLSSPSGRAVMHVDQASDGTLRYDIDYAGRRVIAPSKLGLVTRSETLGKDARLTSDAVTRGADTFALNGPFSHVAHRFRQLTLSLTSPRGTPFQLLFRAYDDGVAFRYVVPHNGGAIHVLGEQTSFEIPADETCYALQLPDYHNSHEGDFNPARVSSLRGQRFIDNPLTCKAAAGAFAIAEADVDHYAGSYLQGTGSGFTVDLSPRIDGSGDAVQYDFAEGPLRSAWRVVMLGDNAGALTQSPLIYALGAPNRIGNTDWVRPGKTAWDWWNGYAVPHVADPGVNTATMKGFIDFAHQFGLPYMMIDDGWYKGSTGKGEFHEGDDITVPAAGLDLPALLAYAKTRGVELMLWVHWTALDRQMDAALAQFERWGIKGIKVDFMDRNDQQMVDFYHRLLGKAAAHHLMVDLHGAYPPNGLARTYPNFVTQEGVLGAEYNKWSDRVTATHNVNLAYTRLLLGPADYTPGGFRNLTPAQFTRDKRQVKPFVQTTRGQALGLFVVMQSPLLMVADSPDAYLRDDGSLTPGADFVRAVPSTWDETRFVAGDVGAYIALARRKDRTWTIGILNTEARRDVALPLSFLPAGSYTARIYADGAKPDALAISERVVTNRDTLPMALAPSGGGAITLTPAG